MEQRLDIFSQRIGDLLSLLQTLDGKCDMICHRKQDTPVDFSKMPLRFIQNPIRHLKIFRLDGFDQFRRVSS